MRGIGIFKEYFSEYTDHYILIGGAACSIILNEIGVDFRITKDLDMVLIAENMNEAFARRVWEFIKTGNYEQREQSEKKSELYRFLKPLNTDFPYMIEIFSRRPSGRISCQCIWWMKFRACLQYYWKMIITILCLQGRKSLTTFL